MRGVTRLWWARLCLAAALVVVLSLAAGCGGQTAAGDESASGAVGGVTEGSTGAATGQEADGVTGEATGASTPVQEANGSREPAAGLMP